MDYPPNQNKYRDMKQEEPPKIQQEKSKQSKINSNREKLLNKIPCAEIPFLANFSDKELEEIKMYKWG